MHQSLDIENNAISQFSICTNLFLLCPPSFCWLLYFYRMLSLYALSHSTTYVFQIQFQGQIGSMLKMDRFFCSHLLVLWTLSSNSGPQEGSLAEFLYAQNICLLLLSLKGSLAGHITLGTHFLSYDDSEFMISQGILFHYQVSQLLPGEFRFFL